MPTPKELGVQVGDTIRIAATCAQEPGQTRRVESVGKTTLHTSCGVTVSLNSPGWQMVHRQPRAPMPEVAMTPGKWIHGADPTPRKHHLGPPPRGVDTALMTGKPRAKAPEPEECADLPAMRLELWEVEEAEGGLLEVAGHVWGHPNHKDGTLIYVTPDETDRGYIEEGLTIKAGGDWYKLGKRTPGPAAVTFEWNGHDAGPEQVILDVLGKTFLHAKTGILYHTAPPAAWDSGRDRWVIQYHRAAQGDAPRTLYVHLPEDFLRPGRFIEVNG